MLPFHILYANVPADSKDLTKFEFIKTAMLVLTLKQQAQYLISKF